MEIKRLCWLVVYIVLGVVGALLSTKLFDEHYFLQDFYIYYTNLTNYLCLGVVISLFIKQYKLVSLNKVKSSKPNQQINFYAKDQPNANSTIKIGKIYSTIIFTSAILIAITFLVYNIWLADYTLNNYFLSLYNILFHVILPLSFIIMAVAISPKVSIFCPFYAFIVQVFYVGFIFVRSKILSPAVGRIVYPYFFLNFETLGVNGSLKWLGFMLLFTMVVGYVLVFINKFIYKLKICKQKSLK